ncbi:hypothetical protein [Microcoleus sp. BROC3]|uniref:hypothetical protein n=1 Tax=Microcoleus sp. BROC3 TaxID=3055323 RepID=UPI002FD58231
MFLNQGTSKPEASQEEEKVNGDMASVLEEELELDDVQLATVVGGVRVGLGFRLINTTEPLKFGEW